jgi:hypothetical protein
MTFSTLAVVPLKSNSRDLALIPMMVNIHEPKLVATVSVGEKVSPLPWLSTGASVISVVDEAK